MPVGAFSFIPSLAKVKPSGTPAAFGITAAPSQIQEGEAGVFTITRTGAVPNRDYGFTVALAGTAVAADYVSSLSSDITSAVTAYNSVNAGTTVTWTAGSNTLTFKNGFAGPLTISRSVLLDALVEADETAGLSLTAVTAGDVVSPASATVTVLLSAVPITAPVFPAWNVPQLAVTIAGSSTAPIPADGFDADLEAVVGPVLRQSTIDALGPPFSTYLDWVETMASRHWALQGSSWDGGGGMQGQNGGNYYSRSRTFFWLNAVLNNTTWRDRAAAIHLTTRTEMESIAYSSSFILQWAEPTEYRVHALKYPAHATADHYGITKFAEWIMLPYMREQIQALDTHTEESMDGRMLGRGIICLAVSLKYNLAIPDSPSDPNDPYVTTWAADTDLIINQTLASQEPDGGWRPGRKVDTNGDPDYGMWVTPFQSAIICNALIWYYDHVFADSRIPLAVKRCVDSLFTIPGLWLNDTWTFLYQEGPIGPPGTDFDWNIPGYDLNNFWVETCAWVFQQTGNDLYRRRADKLFISAFGADMARPTSKPFNEFSAATTPWRYISLRGNVPWDVGCGNLIHQPNPTLSPWLGDATAPAGVTSPNGKQAYRMNASQGVYSGSWLCPPGVEATVRVDIMPDTAGRQVGIKLIRSTEDNTPVIQTFTLVAGWQTIEVTGILNTSAITDPGVVGELVMYMGDLDGVGYPGVITFNNIRAFPGSGALDDLPVVPDVTQPQAPTFTGFTLPRLTISGAGGALTMGTWNATAWVNDGFTSTAGVTFSNVPINAVAGGTVVVAVADTAVANIATLTGGGLTFTRRVMSVLTDGAQVSIFTATASGTVTNATLTAAPPGGSGAAIGEIALAAVSLTAANPVPTATATLPFGYRGQTTLTFAVPTGGLGIVVGMGAMASPTWSSATQRATAGPSGANAYHMWIATTTDANAIFDDAFNGSTLAAIALAQA